jgi:hypothetical protein
VAELTSTTMGGIRCDAVNCSAEIHGETMDWFSGLDHYNALAREAGWSCYVGRSKRHYCPEHSPRPGHKMRVLWAG